MHRNLRIIALSAMAFVFCVPLHGQDSPSRGDIARQAQKDKANKPVVKVITNDDMPSGSGGISTSLAGGSGKFAKPGTPGAANATMSPAEGIEKLQSMLDHVDSQDRATLASNVLEGHDVNFPGRAAWEEKLFAAKQAFVTRGRVLLEKAKQIEVSAEGIKDVLDQNDPRVKSLAAKLQQLELDNQQNSAAFKAVIQEGQDLAAQSPSH